jgi:uncharacterized membrane protein
MASQKKKSSLKVLWWIVGIVIVLIVLVLFFNPHSKINRQMNSAPYASEFDFDNQTVMVGDKAIAFTDGVYKSPDGGHVAQMINRYANQSQTREAAILVDQPGGSGVFFYLVGATKKDGMVSYATPILLGDRVKVESVMVDDNSVTVTYLDHPADEPLSDEPTETKTMTYTFQSDGTLSQ